MHRIVSLITVLVVALALLAPGAAFAKKKKKKKTVYWYQYAVPFTCGDNATDPGRTLMGDHATAVNLFNPGTGSATLYSGLALTFPAGMMVPGWASDRIATALPSRTGTQASCQDVLDLQAVLPPPPIPLPTYAQGFAMIQSSRPLDVHVTHAVEMPGGQVTMSSQKIPHVAIPVPTAP